MTEVVAALIWEGEKFMICQRPAHKARGLLWEFVGGKVEPGETKEQALIRECREELGVTLSVGDVFMDVVHAYPDITVHLTLFNAAIAAGVPQKLEHNDIRWITPREIPDYAFCPADEEILKKIIENSPEAICRLLRVCGKNEIIMETAADETALPPDACKIGGHPYLPGDFAWPVYKNAEDGVTRPLSFFCQINLAEVQPYDKDSLLPPRGMLSFFYECESAAWGFDPADRGAARVFYFECTDGFIPLELPETLAAEYTMPEIAVTFRPRVSYPCFDEFRYHGGAGCDFDTYSEAITALGIDPTCGIEKHKLLGYADVIQSEMLTECERVSRGLYCGNVESYQNTPAAVQADIAAHAADWMLLLQLSTVAKGDFEWMFGDCGMLYFYIRKDDLAARKFDDVHFALQC